VQYSISEMPMDNFAN